MKIARSGDKAVTIYSDIPSPGDGKANDVSHGQLPMSCRLPGLLYDVAPLGLVRRYSRCQVVQEVLDARGIGTQVTLADP